MRIKSLLETQRDAPHPTDGTRWRTAVQHWRGDAPYLRARGSAERRRSRSAASETSRPPPLYLLMSTSVETPIAMLPKASCRVFDWSAFDMPMSSQMFSSIGVTLAVCPAQYCGFFAAARARTLGCCREVMVDWISRSDSLSDVATGT